MNACDLVENWLKDQGFRCERDSNGNVLFRYEGVGMFCRNDSDSSYLNILMPQIYDVEGNREKVLEGISTICSEIKALKAFLVDDSLWLSLEMYIDSTPDIDDFIERCLDIMIIGRRRIAEEIFA